MQRFLDRLGMIGFLAGTAVWVYLFLSIAGPYVGNIWEGFVGTVATKQFDDLRCPLIMSESETKNIVMVIGNPDGKSHLYSVSVKQLFGSGSGEGIVICSQEGTVQPGARWKTSCPVGIETLTEVDPGPYWYVNVNAMTSGDDPGYIDPKLSLSGLCVLRNRTGFLDDLIATLTVVLTGLLVITWGMTLWSGRGWVARAGVVVAALIVWLSTGLINSMVWFGASSLLFWGFPAVVIAIAGLMWWRQRATAPPVPPQPESGKAEQ